MQKRSKNDLLQNDGRGDGAVSTSVLLPYYGQSYYAQFGITLTMRQALRDNTNRAYQQEE
jgi:hypothetical protein